MGQKLLAEWPLFEGVSAQTLRLLERCGRVQALAKGDVILRAHQPQEDIYIQLEGKSIVYNLTHAGSRKILFIFGPGALLNEHVLGKSPSSTYCKAIEPGLVFAVSAAEFLYMMERDFSLAKAVLAEQERKMRRLGHQLKNTVGSIHLERKLAAKLWKLAQDFGVPAPGGIEIDLTLPVTLLADLLGAPRETTSRLCKKLAACGLISVSGKRITIISLEKMAQFYKDGING